MIAPSTPWIAPESGVAVDTIRSNLGCGSVPRIWEVVPRSKASLAFSGLPRCDREVTLAEVTTSTPALLAASARYEKRRVLHDQNSTGLVYQNDIRVRHSIPVVRVLLPYGRDTCGIWLMF